MRVFDLHCDTIDALACADATYFRPFMAEKRGGTLSSNDIQLSADRMGGPWCQCYAIFVPDDLSDLHLAPLEFYRHARDWFAADVTRPDSAVRQVRDALDIDTCIESGCVAGMLTVENGSPLQDLSLVDEFAADGVKMVTLTWLGACEQVAPLYERVVERFGNHLADRMFWENAHDFFVRNETA